MGEAAILSLEKSHRPVGSDRSNEQEGWGEPIRFRVLNRYNDKERSSVLRRLYNKLHAFGVVIESKQIEIETLWIQGNEGFSEFPGVSGKSPTHEWVVRYEASPPGDQSKNGEEYRLYIRTRRHMKKPHMPSKSIADNYEKQQVV